MDRHHLRVPVHVLDPAVGRRIRTRRAVRTPAAPVTSSRLDAARTSASVTYSLAIDPSTIGRSPRAMTHGHLVREERADLDVDGHLREARPYRVVIEQRPPGARGRRRPVDDVAVQASRLHRGRRADARTPAPR